MSEPEPSLPAPFAPLAPAILERKPPRDLVHNEGSDWVAWLHQKLNDPRVAAALVAEFGDSLFMGKAEDSSASSRQTLQDRTWRQPWKYDRAMVFSVGLLSIEGGAETDSPRYRIAVRIQSPRRIKPQCMKVIRARFDAAFNDLVSLRWTSPAVILATNPDGEFKPWKGPNSGRFEPGAPANIAGGAVSALTALLYGTIDGITGYWGLASGHAIHDDFRGKRDDNVYSPPQPSISPDAKAIIGKIHTVRILDRLSLQLAQPAEQSAGVGSSQEYALIAVDPAHLPLQRRMVAGRQYASDLFPGKTGDGARIFKTAARSPGCHGTVRATDFRLEAYDPVTMRSVVADGLIEIELDDGNMALSGDSGTLLCVEGAHSLQVIAQLVGGTRAAVLRPNAHSACVVYGSPLSSISMVNKLDLV